ncbi:hypothetical protein L2E82_36021 [Cichorium intybus]|uniref:Uncharacterized protein n=1 Tax=Cichorium intybus TaxID=13427 RepID=A0ACB9BQH5_CICIN|nr:hypothetical protein L2E82_36021 [Cichorium intybus]
MNLLETFNALDAIFLLIRIVCQKRKRNKLLPPSLVKGFSFSAATGVALSSAFGLSLGFMKHFSMASSSTASTLKSYVYDVFLSFRGEDTRKNFVDHLYVALEQQGIHTFKDDEKLTKGNRINDELLKSIEESKFYIVVFSKNYASSSWCLDELVKIMECQKATEHIAYPVFYDVDPCEVRKQLGPVGEAFARHDNGEVGKWKEALKEAANLAGWDLRNIADGHEAKVINKIVEKISLELRFSNLKADEKLIGMESR